MIIDYFVELVKAPEWYYWPVHFDNPNITDWIRTVHRLMRFRSRLGECIVKPGRPCIADEDFCECYSDDYYYRKLAYKKCDGNCGGCYVMYECHGLD